MKATSAASPVVGEFVKFYIQHAPSLAAEVGAVPLPDQVYQLSYHRFLQKKVGSMFENKSTVSANLVQLLKGDG